MNRLIFILLLLFLSACQLDEGSTESEEATNASPVAEAGDNQTINENTTVTLNASNSSDSDGSISSYLWEQVSGASVTILSSNSVSATFLAPSTLVNTVLVFKLTVTDNDGATHTDNVSITVSPINAIPTASAGIDQTVNEQTTVTLNGTGSADSDGSIATYFWEQVSGASVTILSSNSVSATFSAPSTLVNTVLIFKLTVTDNDGATHTDNVSITVSPINAIPTASAGIDQAVNEQTTVTLNGTGSADSDGSIATYFWEQVSGQNVTLSSTSLASITFTAPTVTAAENLEFRLTVTDNEAGSHTDAINISVSALPRTLSGKVENINNKVTLSGVTITLPDGTIATTDGSGNFTITGLNVEEFATVVASKTGSFTSKTLKFIQSDKTDVLFSLVPIGSVSVTDSGTGCEIKGVITDASNAQPIANVDLYLSHPGADNINQNSDDVNYFVATDSNGNYSFNNMTAYDNHHYSYGALVGKRRDNRNKQYEGHSDYIFSCQTASSSEIKVKNMALSAVVSNTKIIGSLVDNSGNVINKPFKVEIHRMHLGAVANCLDCSNWIDDSLSLDTSKNPYVNFDTLAGTFEITELAGDAVYDLRFEASDYENFSSFSSKGLIAAVNAGQTLNMNSLTVIPVVKADHKLLAPESNFFTSNANVSFSWEAAPAVAGLNSLAFVVYKESDTSNDTTDASIRLPNPGGINVYFSVHLDKATTALDVNFSTQAVSTGAKKKEGLLNSDVGTVYYWGVFGVTQVADSAELYHQLESSILSSQQLGLRKITFQVAD